jgi:hypothetical protein
LEWMPWHGGVAIIGERYSGFTQATSAVRLGSILTKWSRFADPSLMPK